LATRRQAVDRVGGARQDHARRCDDCRGRAFALVVEGVAESLAHELTAAVAMPTIGIGGSPACDGQILVVDDMLGLFTEFTPKFVKRYPHLGDEIRAAAREYAEEVRQGRFPAPEHTYSALRSLDFSQSGSRLIGGTWNASAKLTATTARPQTDRPGRGKHSRVLHWI
jgi:hypothetical protein